MSRHFRFRSRFTRWALSVPVRVKIMGIVLGVIFLPAFVVTLQVRATIRATMQEELGRLGTSVARDVAGRAEELILFDKPFALKELVLDRLTTDREIEYVFIVGRSQESLAHAFDHPSTFDHPPTLELIQANSVARDQEVSVKVLQTEQGRIWDAAVPIRAGLLGTVRVGMSEMHLQEVVDATTRFMVALTAVVSLVGVAAAFLLTALVTRPIRDLVTVTEAVGRGDLQQKAAVWSEDEIGRLSTAFNAMTEALAKSRDEIERFNRRLLQRNEELSVLNAVAMTVSRSLDLTEILDGALEQVLDGTKLKAGWIFLDDSPEHSNRRQHLVLVASEGLSDAFVDEETNKKFGDCICREVMTSGAPRMVDDMRTCPRLSREVLEREGLRCHVSIPLKAKNEVLGIMNVACPDGHALGEEDLRLLTSIGHQIGIAVENARLYEEVQQKEALRRRLLDKLIRAQEEERKRVARELHDQVGQSLTALIMALGSAEEMIPAEAKHAKARLGQIRTMMTGVVEGIRQLMMDLRPALLDDLGLIPAIRSFAESRLGPAGVKIRVEVEGDRRKLPPQVDIALFRIVQEAVANIVKHAAASQAVISLHFNESSVTATIEDDGKGFAGQGPRTRAFGLLGMEERAALLGGNLNVDSQEGRGTRITLEVPTPAG